MTLNLAQKSFKVIDIDFGINRKCVYIFLSVVNSNLIWTLSCTVSTLPDGFSGVVWRVRREGERQERLGQSAVKLFS